jgi:hypothetical protein
MIDLVGRKSQIEKKYVTSSAAIAKLTMNAAFDTIWPADSVEFCPTNLQNLLVCGTYKLDSSQEQAEYSDMNSLPKKQYRRGKCLLFEVITSGHQREL